jgi:hypothetical protein
MVTLAFGIAPPFESFTEPETRPEFVWPCIAKLPQAIKTSNIAILLREKFCDPELFRLCISNLQRKNSELKQLISFGKNDRLPIKLG